MTQKPTRRSFLKSTLPAAALLAGCRSTPTSPPQSTTPPNILFLLTDDHRWDALSCMGNPILRTPNIDRLASTGTTFDNMFVTTSICCASRASIFTGQYARRTGIHEFNVPFTPAALAQTYPQILRRAGYRIGFVGKYGVGDNSPPPAGQFDFWRGFTGQGQYFPDKSNPSLHLTDLMTSQANEFLQSASPSQPFCLSISYKAPHCQDGDPRQFLYAPRYESLYSGQTIPTPLTATDEFFQKQPDFIRNSESRNRWKIRFSNPDVYQKMVKAYYRLLVGVDDSVAALLKTLADRNLIDNTIIFFTGDNGFYLGEHGLAGKWFMHEESIRVPLIIHDPRLPQNLHARRCSDMALNIDLAPTILSLAGLTPPPQMQGRPLTPLLQSQSPSWRTDFFYEHLFKHSIIPKTEGVRTTRYSYWQYLNVDHDAHWLFDLATDPHQTQNLAADPYHQPLVQNLQSRLTHYRQSLL
ncbi:MAG: sulfatase [Planctomycetota bacterium]|nr:sulfatase [Planctomycetota bacterium]